MVTGGCLSFKLVQFPVVEIQVRRLLPLFDSFHKAGWNDGIVKVHSVLGGG